MSARMNSGPEDQIVQGRIDALHNQYERVMPHLLGTLAAIRESNARKCADMGVTPEQWKALSFEGGVAVLRAWARTHQAEIRAEKIRAYVWLRLHGKTDLPVGRHHDQTVSMKEAARRVRFSPGFAERVCEPLVAQARVRGETRAMTGAEAGGTSAQLELADEQAAP